MKIAGEQRIRHLPRNGAQSHDGSFTFSLRAQLASVLEHSRMLLYSMPARVWVVRTPSTKARNGLRVSMMHPFQQYLQALRRNLAQGDSTEHTHRSALQTLLKAVEHTVDSVNEAQRIACGAPDLSMRKSGVPIGHIETKDIGTNLDEVEKGRGPHGKQFLRYRDGLPNWILTDYLRFDWYVAGEFRKRATLATLEAGKLKPVSGGEAELDHLFDAFLSQPAVTIDKARDLAKRMAGTTHLLREAIESTFHQGSSVDISWLNHWVASFREVLIPELKEGEFADMFAQTLAYGLFAARVQTAKTGERFSRETALLAVPKSNPFLRSIFAQMAGPDMPDVFAWAVDDLLRLLAYADIGSIIADFGHAAGQDDPVVHFYETFLAAYDPELRETRGVYYTPEPVVQYIVRSVDSLLKTHFNKRKGLADENSYILDPATGTATFLYFVIRQIKETMAGQQGAWPSYVHDHLLRRIFGFELLMAPYAIAHLKLALELEETGFSFREGERLGIYLTNTLEEAAKRSQRLIAQAISREADEAARIKQEEPILVILGNPPYSGHSANSSRDTNGDLTFIGKLIEDYKQVNGAMLGERNPKWLQNDYVKFIRFAQWRLETKEPNCGILAFITDNGYLNNPTFRGMRSNLLNSFTQLYVLNLHGSSKPKEHAPGGGEDENVFAIQQGVAILLAVRDPNHRGEALVYYSDLWGSQAQKYVSLLENDINSTDWTEFIPTAPSFLFTPQDDGFREEYEAHFKINEVFPENSLGIATARDRLTIHFTREELWQTIHGLCELGVEEARQAYNLGPDARDWAVERAQSEMREYLDRLESITKPILYRPFDIRFTAYTGKSRGFHCMPRRKVMGNFLSGTNLGILFSRNVEIEHPEHFFCANTIAGHHSVSLKEVNYEAPLYLEAQSEVSANGALFAHRHLNLADAFLQRMSTSFRLPRDLETHLPEGITAEEIFGYVYAVVHSPEYRVRYADFLKLDFPRIPLTTDLELFRTLSLRGQAIASIHLLDTDASPALNQFMTGFPITGSNQVDRVEYRADNRRVWINDSQYFSDVPEDLWTFTVGGFQVCEKWLKDRTGRQLTYADTEHWQRMVVAASETRRLMEVIDDDIPGWPLP